MYSILQITLPGLASVLLAAGARGEERPRPPAGESVRTPVTRDTWFSQVRREADANPRGALCAMAAAFPPDKDGWQRVAVDPAVVAARVAGVSYGFLLFDDTGSEWARQGEKFTLHHFPNRFVHSRESGAANAPYLTVFL